MDLAIWMGNDGISINGSNADDSDLPAPGEVVIDNILFTFSLDPASSVPPSLNDLLIFDWLYSPGINAVDYSVLDDRLGSSEVLGGSFGVSFNTIRQIEPVPAPGVFWIILIGLAGLLRNSVLGKFKK